MIILKVIFLGLITKAIVLSFDLPRNISDCSNQNTLKIDEEYFALTRIIDIGDSTPTNAQYDVYGNLFFIQMEYKNRRLNYDAYVLKQNAETPVKIDGLPEGSTYCTALDNTYEDVYFGTATGIFRYDYESSNATRDSGSHIKPNMLIVDKDGNKYISESSNDIEELYLLEGEKKVLDKRIQGFNEIAIDSDNNIFSVQGNGLFILQVNEDNATLIRELCYNGVAQINFYKDVVFVASGQVIYFHKNGINTIKRWDLPYNIVALGFYSKGSITLGTRGKLLQYNRFDCVSYIHKS